MIRFSVLRKVGNLSICWKIFDHKYILHIFRHSQNIRAYENFKRYIRNKKVWWKIHWWQGVFSKFTFLCDNSIKVATILSFSVFDLKGFIFLFQFVFWHFAFNLLLSTFVLTSYFRRKSIWYKNASSFLQR